MMFGLWLLRERIVEAGKGNLEVRTRKIEGCPARGVYV
jgi:hypothetical protein